MKVLPMDDKLTKIRDKVARLEVVKQLSKVGQLKLLSKPKNVARLVIYSKKIQLFFIFHKEARYFIQS
jgi:hypothetical protein